MLRYYIYCRKSSESEDRQVLSIESQTNELKRLAEKLNLNVIGILSESQSAKSPGRPLFDQMIHKINQGEADGLVCWKLDRLARNPIDGGQITWLLQRGIIKHIQTYDRSYYPEDNVLLMNVEFGMANQFVLDLSKNVKRGLKTKVEKGWLPTTAPLGYQNDKSKGKGLKEIGKDPERFELVKRMWKLMLMGKYTPPKIAKMADEKWGFRTPQGRKVSRSTIYQIFTNPFYYGWFEYPKESGNWYQGSHEPMISQEEYEKVQILLGRKGKSRRRRRNFAFTGLIRCNECGAMITAEEKNQIICSRCKYKFSSNNRVECPKCKTSIMKMKKPTVRRYVYYHCGKMKNPNCTQKSIEVRELEKQIDQFLSQIHISEGFKTWSIKYLKEANDKEILSRERVFASQRRAYDSCIKKLENLFQLKISPLNSDGSLLSDQEYAKQKTDLINEKARLEEILDDTQGRIEEWLKIGEQIFEFACYAKSWFADGTAEEKTEILRALGSNLTLRDKKLLIEPQKSFWTIAKVVKGVPEVRASFEPKIRGLHKLKLEYVFARSSMVLRGLDKIRTWIKEESALEGLYIPSFQDMAQKAA